MPTDTDAACYTPNINWTIAQGATVDRPLAWPLDFGCCDAYTSELALGGAAAAEATALMLRMGAAAIDLLFTSTCSRFSARCDWVRPCTPHTCCGGDDTGFYCADECDRKSLNLRDLVADDIIEVLEIQISDGVTNAVVVVPTTDYELDRSVLVPYRDGMLWTWPRQSRNDPFPSRAGSGRPTWRILVRHGVTVPESLVVAASDLACNLFNACRNKPCDIPANAISVTREGVSVQLETGLKAIPSVKMALETYGDCKKLKPRSRITDPSTWITQ